MEGGDAPVEPQSIAPGQPVGQQEPHPEREQGVEDVADVVGDLPGRSTSVIANQPASYFQNSPRSLSLPAVESPRVSEEPLKGPSARRKELTTLLHRRPSIQDLKNQGIYKPRGSATLDRLQCELSSFLQVRPKAEKLVDQKILEAEEENEGEERSGTGEEEASGGVEGAQATDNSPEVTTGTPGCDNTAGGGEEEDESSLEREDRVGSTLGLPLSVEKKLSIKEQNEITLDFHLRRLKLEKEVRRRPSRIELVNQSILAEDDSTDTTNKQKNFNGFRARLGRFLKARPSVAEANSATRSDVQKRPVFGVALLEAIQSESEETLFPGIPSVVHECVEYITNSGFGHEGIFRVSPPQTEVQAARTKYDQLGISHNEESNSIVSDPYVAASLLKMFFRELPEPLLTFALYPKFVSVMSNDQISEEERANEVAVIISHLPSHNWLLFRYLVSFLINVADNADVNMMTAHNLGVVFGPNLLRPQHETFETMQDQSHVNAVVVVCINQFETIFAKMPGNVSQYVENHADRASCRLSRKLNTLRESITGSGEFQATQGGIASMTTGMETQVRLGAGATIAVEDATQHPRTTEAALSDAYGDPGRLTITGRSASNAAPPPSAPATTAGATIDEDAELADDASKDIQLSMQNVNNVGGARVGAASVVSDVSTSSGDVDLGFREYSTANTLFSWGRGHYGQLGHDEIQHEVARKIEAFPEDRVVAAVSCGGRHSMVLTVRGEVWTFGAGDDGSLGHGDKQDRLKPIRICFFKDNAIKIVDVTAGSSHSLAVDSDGHVWAWGRNTHGQVGSDVDIGGLSLVPTQLNAFEKTKEDGVAFAVSGARHCLAIDKKKRVFAWGWNELGQLGLGTTKNSSEPLELQSLRDLKVMDLACGYAHSAAITENGDLYTWGYGKDGQLGHGDSKTVTTPALVKSLVGKAVRSVALGKAHSLALMEQDGSVFSFGKGSSGVLGHGNSRDKKKPTQVSALTAMSVKVLHVFAGESFSGALADNGTVFTWGKSEYNQLGYEASTKSEDKPLMVANLRGPYVSKVACGDNHCLAGIISL